MRKMGMLGSSVAAAALACGLAGAEVTQFQATLSGANEVPPNKSAGTGSVTFEFDSETNTLSIVSGEYAGLSATVTASHVHGLAPAGQNAGVVFAITHTGGTSGTLSGSGVLTAQQVEGLFNELLYVNVHTTAFPGGEIRGQLIEVPAKPKATTTVVFSEITTHPSSIVPGALDPEGNPVEAHFIVLSDIQIRPDGSQWVLTANTDLPTDYANILLLGSGTSATPLAQEGQPVPGGLPGEVWDFFDSDYPASFNENGDIAFSGRAKGGPSSVKEKIIKVINGVPTLFATESTPVTVFDDPNGLGNELIGNSVGSVSFLNDGSVFFGNTPIQNCHSSRYPGLFIDTQAFAQSGVTTLEPPFDHEVWDSFGYNDCGMAPDGKNWFGIGDTENPDTSIDAIFAVNNIKIAQENTELGDTGIIVGSGNPFFFCRMIANGDWFLRGDDTADNDWAIRGNGDKWSLIAKTGDPITSGSTEHWGDTFTSFHGNSKGDWVLTGNTDNGDPLTDTVLVLNGEQVILRENDPIDLDGNGQFDDDVFIGNTNSGTLISGFHANDLLISDDRVIHVIVTLRNGANTVLGDAYLQIDLGGGSAPCVGDIDGDGGVGVTDLLAVINAWGPCGPGSCPADINSDGSVGVSDLLAIINAWGACTK